jgi:ABC-type multidrug transport system permease subunit
MIKVVDLRTLINGPCEKIQKMSNEKVNEIQKFVVSHILFITFLVAILIMAVSIGQVMVASEKAASFGFSVPIVVTLIIGESIYMALKAMRLMYKENIY